MILLTVGTQLPFDRLVRAVDNWCATSKQTVFGQIGPSKYTPQNFEFRDFIASYKLDELFAAADFIIAHAGMGSIISALSLSKPIIIAPRRADLGEHRNDHQLATARRFGALPLVRTVFDVQELGYAIEDLISNTAAQPSAISPYAPESMLEQLKLLINEPR